MKWMNIMLCLVVFATLSGCGLKSQGMQPEPETAVEAMVVISEKEPETVSEEKATEEEPTTEAESTEESTEEESTEAGIEQDWAANLKVAGQTDQLVIVSATGNKAVVSMHTKDDNGVWSEVVSTNGRIGKNGVGKTAEGDGKTPRGSYRFLFAFGSLENPGTKLPYTQVDSSYYWVDDSNSSYYNKFVSTNTTAVDWSSAENILAAGDSYHYVLATSYNEECTPKKGSAIFMHCLPTGGAGCIAVPESSMKEIVKNIREDCILIIDEESNIMNY